MPNKIIKNNQKSFIVKRFTIFAIQWKSRKKTYRAFIAVYADDIRLIDNIALN